MKYKKYTEIYSISPKITFYSERDGEFFTFNFEGEVIEYDFKDDATLTQGGMYYVSIKDLIHLDSRTLKELIRMKDSVEWIIN